MLVQLLLWFNLALFFPRLGFGPVSADTNDLIKPFVAALLALALNEAAYMAEVVRGGILAVDPGQTEASHALGHDQGQTMRRIVLPQAMRVIIPPTGNETITMLKTTSLVAGRRRGRPAHPDVRDRGARTSPPSRCSWWRASGTSC